MKINGLLLIGCLMYATFSWAQGNVVRVKINTRDDNLGIRLDGVNLTVSENGKIFETLTSDAYGKFKVFDLPLQHVYWIELSKPGFVSKCVEIDTRFSYPEDLPPVIYQQMEISLFRPCWGVDWSFTRREAWARFHVSKDGYIDYDKNHTRTMLKKIKELKLQCSEALVIEPRKETEESPEIMEEEHALMQQEPELQPDYTRLPDWQRERLKNAISLLNFP